MSKIRLSLRNFFQKQQAEEQQETLEPVPTTEETNQQVPEETEPDTEEPAEPDTTDETPAPEATVTTAGSPTAEEPVRTEEMSVADYDALVADAGSWRTNKAELERLRSWHSNSQKSGTLATTDANGGGSNQSWKDAPWNQ